MIYQKIDNNQSLKDLLLNSEKIEYKLFQNLDFVTISHLLNDHTFENCIFMGCNIPEYWDNKKNIKNLIFPAIDVPFDVYTSSLYNKDKLYGGYVQGNPESFNDTYDQVIYRHYLHTKAKEKNIKELLACRIHDHSITEALNDLLSDFPEKKIVAIMGGHNIKRDETGFYEIASLSKKLTEKGFLMISGGGPGAMEATHVGAWFANKSEDILKQACKILGEAPDYKHPFWLDKAWDVLSIYPTTEFKSIGIPTWHYGHEPSTPFASHIAKYFENSIREDGLLSIAKGGVVFTPGSAGTLQEIFQEAVQNHYLVFGYASPMIFFNKKYWTEEIPVVNFIQQMITEGKYKNLIFSVLDTNEDVVAALERFLEN